jgi:hypothetical protein
VVAVNARIAGNEREQRPERIVLVLENFVLPRTWHIKNPG